MPIPVRIIVQFDQLNRAVMMVISPIRFGDGGRAILARLDSNHHVPIRGRIDCRPRESNRARLCVRS